MPASTDSLACPPTPKTPTPLQAGFLAQKRLARGVRLNYPGACVRMASRSIDRASPPQPLAPHTNTSPFNSPEAVALIAAVLMELVRDGGKSVAELMDLGRNLLGHRQVRCLWGLCERGIVARLANATPTLLLLPSFLLLS